jgi:hypothetical protein
VLPWLGEYKKGERHPCDPDMLSLISSSTMLFAPFLDRQVVVEIICAATPSLYLGNELLEDVVDHILVSLISQGPHESLLTIPSEIPKENYFI